MEMIKIVIAFWKEDVDFLNNYYKKEEKEKKEFI